MKSINITFLLIAILCFCNSSFCQENLDKATVKKYENMVLTAEGTYQIQLIDTRSLATVPLSVIEKIESKRSDTETIYFYINDYTRVKVLSKQEINVPNFTPIEKFKNISSSELNNK